MRRSELKCVEDNVMLPWWGWVLVALWCLPGIYFAFALLLQKPIGGLDENGEVPKPIPVFKKVVMFPLVLAILLVLWPHVLWVESRHTRY
jgi:hypothetical protein